MTDSSLLRRASRAYAHYLALGNEVVEDEAAFFVRNRALATVWDANHVALVRAGSEIEIEALLARVEAAYAGIPQRVFHCDPETSAAFEARLVLEGYELRGELQLLLDGELVAKPGACRIRLAESDADWERLHELGHIDAIERARREHRAPYPEALCRQLVGGRRAKGPEVLTWIASADGVDCAHFSSWPGVEGVGKVEDLFTLPAFRHRGIATALIVHAVEDARARGAEQVLIGADTSDTPKHMYAALGFRPCFVVRGYLREIAAGN